ncbi:gluzincin family metallopeptidase [Endothiovibrio diazotrophicus]
MLFAPNAWSTPEGIPDAIDAELIVNEVAPQGRQSEIECRFHSRVGLLPDTRLTLGLPEDARVIGGTDHLDYPLADSESASFTARVVFTGKGYKEVRCVAASDSHFHRGAAAIQYLHIGPDRSTVGAHPFDPARPLSVVWPDGASVVRLPSEENYPVPHRDTPPPDAPIELAVGQTLADMTADAGQSSRRSVSMTVNGRFQFTQVANSSTLLSEVALVEIVDATDNNVLHSCYTSMQGYYSCGPFTLSGNAVRVRWSPYFSYLGDEFMVLNPEMGTDKKLDNTWSFTTGKIYAPMNGSYQIGTYIVDMNTPPQGTYVAFNLLKDILDVWRYIYNEAGVYESPVQTGGSAIVQYHWDYLHGYAVPTHYDFYDDRIYMDGSADGAGDRYVAAHEYGHAVMRYMYYPSYPNAVNCASHHIYSESSVGCAWSEGWAEFLAMLPRSDGLYRGHNVEAASWGYNDGHAWQNGPAVEGRVVGSLWDLLDNVADGYDQYSDGNIRRIWEIVHDDHPMTFQAFIDAWVARGYPVAGPANSLYQNTIQ